MRRGSAGDHFFEDRPMQPIHLTAHRQTRWCPPSGSCDSSAYLRAPKHFQTVFFEAKGAYSSFPFLLGGCFVGEVYCFICLFALLVKYIL